MQGRNQTGVLTAGARIVSAALSAVLLIGALPAAAQTSATADAAELRRHRDLQPIVHQSAGLYKEPDPWMITENNVFITSNPNLTGPIEIVYQGERVSVESVIASPIREFTTQTLHNLTSSFDTIFFDAGVFRNTETGINPEMDLDLLNKPGLSLVGRQSYLCDDPDIPPGDTVLTRDQAAGGLTPYRITNQNIRIDGIVFDGEGGEIRSTADSRCSYLLNIFPQSGSNTAVISNSTIRDFGSGAVLVQGSLMPLYNGPIHLSGITAENLSSQTETILLENCENVHLGNILISSCSTEGESYLRYSGQSAPNPQANLHFYGHLSAPQDKPAFLADWGGFRRLTVPRNLPYARFRADTDAPQVSFTSDLSFDDEAQAFFDSGNGVWVMSYDPDEEIFRQRLQNLRRAWALLDTSPYLLPPNQYVKLLVEPGTILGSLRLAPLAMESVHLHLLVMENNNRNNPPIPFLSESRVPVEKDFTIQYSGKASLTVYFLDFKREADIGMTQVLENYPELELSFRNCLFSGDAEEPETSTTAEFPEEAVPYIEEQASSALQTLGQSQPQTDLVGGSVHLNLYQERVLGLSRIDEEGQTGPQEPFSMELVEAPRENYRIVGWLAVQNKQPASDPQKVLSRDLSSQAHKELEREQPQTAAGGSVRQSEPDVAVEPFHESEPRIVAGAIQIEEPPVPLAEDPGWRGGLSGLLGNSAHREGAPDTGDRRPYSLAAVLLLTAASVIVSERLRRK